MKWLILKIKWILIKKINKFLNFIFNLLKPYAIKVACTVFTVKSNLWKLDFQKLRQYGSYLLMGKELKY